MKKAFAHLESWLSGQKLNYSDYVIRIESLTPDARERLLEVAREELRPAIKAGEEEEGFYVNGTMRVII